MTAYRCYILNQSGHFAGVEALDCQSDEEARQHGQRLMAERKLPGVEIWQGCRRVGSLGRSKHMAEAHGGLPARHDAQDFAEEPSARSAV